MMNYIKNKQIKTLLGFFLLFILSANTIKAQGPSLPFHGDLKFENESNLTIKATMEAVSVPFEGVTILSDTGQIQHNRYKQVQNGSTWKMWWFNTAGGGTFDIRTENIAYISAQNSGGDLVDLGHCTGLEYPHSSITGTWGFAKYLITFTVVGTGETYKCYLNCQDSEYQKLISHANRYGADLFFIFNDDLPPNRRLLFQKDQGGSTGFSIIDTISTWDTLSNGKPSKEFKTWEVIYGDTAERFGSEFYVRATPFPYDKYSAENRYRDLVVGSTITFDTVYKNLGSEDRFGYNTENDPYYNDPPIPVTNVKGNIFVTPGGFSVYNGNPIAGMTITAESGDTVIMKKDKRLFVNGLGSGNGIGDSLILNSGSVLILEENAEIAPNRGGTVILNGTVIQLDSAACFRAFAKSNISINGNNTIDNGAFLVIDPDARLNIGDNTTLTIDGPNSFLYLDSRSDVNIGQNSKIEFTNGAYLVADSVDFTCSSTWEGIVLDNPGVQTKITNCTFNNAKKTITLTNDSTNAYNNYEIRNNTFNQPDSTAYAIYVENTFNLQITGNTFTHQLNKGSSVFVKNFYNSGHNGGDGLPNYNNLNITGNTFTNAKNSLVLLSYASNLTSFYIYGNTFNGTSGQYNLLGRMITGSIKNNNFANTNVSRAIYLTQSNPKLHGNTIKSDGANLISSNAYPSLAPTRDGNGNFVWNAGSNTLNSTSGDNIQTDKGNVYTDYGNNSFTVSSTSKYHMYGRIDTNIIKYYSRNNCWSPGNIPLNFVWDVMVAGEFNQLPFIYNSPGYTCNQTYTATSNIVSDMGGRYL